jgi:ZIP family zinc transporter
MVVLAHLALVFVAGLATALATGLGAIPFFFIDEFSDRWNVGLWGVASGIMVAASLFGLINEGMQYASDGFPVLMLTGLLTGVALVEGSGRVLSRIDINATGPDESGHGDDGYPRDEGDKQTDPAPDIGTDGGPEATPDIESQEHDDNPLEAEVFADGDLKTLLLILGILTVHSFPEGVAVGVSFAEIGFDGGIGIFGIGIPLLAVFMQLLFRCERWDSQNGGWSVQRYFRVFHSRLVLLLPLRSLLGLSHSFRLGLGLLRVQ